MGGGDGDQTQDEPDQQHGPAERHDAGHARQEDDEPGEPPATIPRVSRCVTGPGPVAFCVHPCGERGGGAGDGPACWSCAGGRAQGER